MDHESFAGKVDGKRTGTLYQVPAHTKRKTIYHKHLVVVSRFTLNQLQDRSSSGNFLNNADRFSLFALIEISQLFSSLFTKCNHGLTPGCYEVV